MITEKSNFSAIWPSVFAETVAWLAARGVNSQAAEDATQEAGARALVREIPFETAEDLRPWICTVAWRISVVAHRKSMRLERERDHPTRAADVDVEVEGRLALESTYRAIGRLSASDRRAIIGGIHGEATADRRETVRLAVRRHRARARLLLLVEGVAAFGLFVVRKVRWSGAAVAASLALLPVLFMLPLLVGPPSNSSSAGSASADYPADIAMRAPATHAIAELVDPTRVASSKASAARRGASGAFDDRPGAPVAEAAVPPANSPTDGTVVGARPREEKDPIACVNVRPVGQTVCGPADIALPTVP